MNALGEMVLGQGEAFHAKLVSPAGLEPATHSLEGCCSVQLSYGEGGWSGREDSNLRPPAPKAGALPDCATPRRGARNKNRTLPSTDPIPLHRLRRWPLVQPVRRKRRLPLARGLRIEQELERVSVRAQPQRLPRAGMLPGRRLVVVLDFLDALELERRLQVGILVVNRVLG